MDVDMHSENVPMDIVQAGHDPSAGDMLKVEDGHPMDIDEVRGGDDGDVYMHDVEDGHSMDIDEVWGGDDTEDIYMPDDFTDVDDGEQMEGIEIGDADEETLMDIDHA
ncbi:uncharacterized protein F5891DRAFT_1187900 [Suillus fuscotomentosus]|uniref:Uncharacterized protein n=1 Tax=Suillus fuscotomentosus TaxID=1912939 RepID=A0AAD4EA29_9AGAM|nr:uncharacterized protein F5891DRAFT_1187900 [Suillus fuscotomentosus]KAG1901204.1 hypothetical protein F5891DRAFT_1187900 [Suillus fuscotomentosus]